MADLKTNLLGFVMNSPIIGASATVGYGVENEELADALDEAIAAQDAAPQPFAGLAKAGRYRCQCG